jgi:hypothetical protein
MCYEPQIHKSSFGDGAIPCQLGFQNPICRTAIVSERSNNPSATYRFLGSFISEVPYYVRIWIPTDKSSWKSVRSRQSRPRLVFLAYYISLALWLNMFICRSDGAPVDTSPPHWFHSTLITFLVLSNLRASFHLPIRVLRPSDIVPPLTYARIGSIKPSHCELKALSSNDLGIIHLAVAPPSCSIQLAMPWGSTT